MRRVFIALLLMVTLGAGMFPLASAQQSDSAALDLIAALNAWRIEGDLWPLKPNDTLETLAIAQAAYLLSLPELPDDLHRGREGDYSPDRARRAGWPTYGRADLVAVSEIAYAGASVDRAIAWWQQSTVHRNTVLNPAYREVGVAALPHPYGYLFIVVVGARPNVLPTLIDPETNTLYLSDERFTGAERSDAWLDHATQVRLFDAEGKPLDQEWQLWRLTLALPATAGDRIFVAYSDGKQEVLSEVRFDTDRALLPERLASQPPTATPAAPPDTLPLATSAPAPASAPAQQDVLLVYHSRALAVINTASHPLDLSGLELVQGATALPITRWQTPWLSGSLLAFPARDCLQVWSWNEPNELPKPNDCQTVRGIINVAPDQLFWARGDFEARWEGNTLARCLAEAGRCGFALPPATP